MPQPPLVKKRYSLKDERLVKTTTENVYLVRGDAALRRNAIEDDLGHLNLAHQGEVLALPVPEEQADTVRLSGKTGAFG